jgi:hypothetical protein
LSGEAHVVALAESGCSGGSGGSGDKDETEAAGDEDEVAVEDGDEDEGDGDEDEMEFEVEGSGGGAGGAGVLVVAAACSAMASFRRRLEPRLKPIAIASLLTTTNNKDLINLWVFLKVKVLVLRLAPIQ